MTAETLSAYVRLPYENLIKNKLQNNLNAFKILKAKTRKIINETKKKSWQNYVNQLASSTRTNTIWAMMSEISGKSQPTALKHLTKNKTEATSKKVITDTLAETFSENSSINYSSPCFLTFKNKSEKQKLNFKSNNSEKYNQPFIPAELQAAIETLHNTAVGPDEIPYEFLKHLPQNWLDYLLTIFDDIWINSKLPESWKITTIIPISKPGRDSSNTANYYPIALTSGLGKTMERMANRRSVWFLSNLSPLLNVDSESGDQQLIAGFKLGTSKRGQNLKTTPYISLLWSGEGLQYHLEVWNNERPT